MSKHHWKYVSAQAKGKISAEASMPDVSEYFELVAAGGNKYTLKTAFGKYVCAEKGFKIVADREKASDWETFSFEPVGGKDEYAIKTHHGRYLSAQPKGGLEGDREKVQDWEIFVVTGDKPTGPSLIQRKWVKVDGPKLVSISGIGETVVGITAKGEAHQFFSGAWSPLPEKFKSIAVGFDKTILGIDTNNKVRRFEENDTFSEVPFGIKETPVVIAGQDYNNFIVVTKEKSIFKWTDCSWAPVHGPKFVQASIGEDGSMWAITEKFDPYRLNPDGGWENIPGSLDQITVRNKNEVVGNNQKDEIFFWNGNTWQRFDGFVKWLSLGSDLWGVTAAGTIWNR